MRPILLATAISLLSVNLAFAQAPAGTTAAPPAGTSTGAAPTATPTNTVHDDKAAASGDNNQAVVTTGANADQPASGHNSFTAGQARHRIAKKGFSHVIGLKKDTNGVWRGTAMKDGQSVQVWLDYKGNVGQVS